MTTVTAQLTQQLRMLKLSGMLEHFDARVMEAANNDLSHAEFFSMLLTDELEERTNRKLSRLLRRAALGSEKTIEGFDFHFNTSINQKLIKSFSTCRFVEKGESIFFLGPTGTGKTHLAKALAHHACRFMFSVAFYNFHQLFSEMATADLQNRLPSMMKRLLAVDLLLIDDFAFRNIDQHSAERLYAIVDGRFGNKSMILTSNRSITDWGSLFSDPVMGNAIMDRLANAAHHVVIKGQSYRKNLMPKDETL
jgi:DNA replication protein DnaC